MTPNGTRIATRTLIAAAVAVFGLFGYGCGGSSSSSSLSGSFSPSTTATAAGLVKLVPKTSSGARIVVQAVLYGPDPTLDLYTFAFDVKIGDPSVLRFVAGSAVAGNALVASGSQTITALAAPNGMDVSDIVVGVGKLGGGAGNGIAGASAVVVELTFDVLKAGTSTLAIATSPAPAADDSTGAAIGAVTFDAAAGLVTGISTGGGGY
jgi:hypothetical protein